MNIVFLTHSSSAILRHLVTGKWQRCLTIVDFSADGCLAVMAKNACVRYKRFVSWEILADEIRPDLLISSKLNVVIPEWVINLSQFGGINIHPSLLPKYRGLNPWFEAYCAHDLQGGVSIHRLSKDFDAGEIIAQGRFNIQHGDPLPVTMIQADTLAVSLLDEVLDNELYRSPGIVQDSADVCIKMDLAELKEYDVHRLWHVLRGFPELLHILFPLTHRFYEVGYPSSGDNGVEVAELQDGKIICKDGVIPLIDFSKSAMASDYIEAINRDNIVDPMIRKAEFERDIDGRIVGVQGREAIVFPLRIDGKKYALRCLKNMNISEAERYASRIKAVSTALNGRNISHFVAAHTIAQAFKTDKGLLPAILMDYCTGRQLSDFLIEHINDKEKIEALQQEFVQVCASNHLNGIVHGDLHAGNIIIGDNAKITIIDIDNLCINPGAEAVDVGANRTCQHPLRRHNKRLFAGIDAFSEIIIYVNICCVLHAPDLYTKLSAQGNVFRVEDYVRPDESDTLKELNSVVSMRPLISKLKYVLSISDIQNIPNLQNFIEL